MTAYVPWLPALRPALVIVVAYAVIPGSTSPSQKPLRPPSLSTREVPTPSCPPPVVSPTLPTCPRAQPSTLVQWTSPTHPYISPGQTTCPTTQPSPFIRQPNTARPTCQAAQPNPLDPTTQHVTTQSDTPQSGSPAPQSNPTPSNPRHPNPHPSNPAPAHSDLPLTLHDPPRTGTTTHRAPARFDPTRHLKARHDTSPHHTAHHGPADYSATKQQTVQTIPHPLRRGGPQKNPHY